MVSPCPPRTMAFMFSIDTFSSSEIKVENLIESRMPAMPITLSLGKPLTSYARWHIASKGLLTMMRIELGENLTTSFTTPSTISIFFAKRSSLLIPGFLVIPAVITTMSLPSDPE